MKWLRRLLTAVAVASALSAAGLAVAAWRNRETIRLVGVGRSDGETFRLVVVTPTRVELASFDLPAGVQPDTNRWVWHVGRTVVYSVVESREMAEPSMSFVGIPNATTTTIWGDRFGRVTMTGWGNLRLVWAPTWAVLFAVAVPAVLIFGTRLLRRRLRFGPGRCRRCGVRPAGDARPLPRVRGDRGR